MSNRLRWTIFGSILAVAIVAMMVFLLPGSGTPAPAEARISVREIINQVETDRRGEAAAEIGNFLPASVGQDLMPGDWVKTSPDSEVRVDIWVKDFLRITRTTPNTVWRLGQFAPDQRTVIELDQGKIFLLDKGLGSQGDPFVVVTPAGKATPRGTWMSVGYDPVTEVAEVQCFRGSCELKNDLGVQVLTDEQKSRATATDQPTEPKFLDPQEREIFVDLPEAKTGEVPVPTPVVVPPPVTPVPTVTVTPAPTSTPAVAVSLTPAKMPLPTEAWLSDFSHLLSPVPKGHGPLLFLNMETYRKRPDLQKALNLQAMRALAALPPSASALLNSVLVAMGRPGQGAVVVLDGPIDVANLLQVASSFGISSEPAEPEAYRDHRVWSVNVFGLALAVGTADEATAVLGTGSSAQTISAKGRVEAALDAFDGVQPRVTDDPTIAQVVDNLPVGVVVAVFNDCVNLSSPTAAPGLDGCIGAGASAELLGQHQIAINAVALFQQEEQASAALETFKLEGIRLGALVLEKITTRQEGSLVRVRLITGLDQISSAFDAFGSPGP